MEDCHVVELRHRGEPAEFPGELHKEEIPPAKAANSIALKEDLFNFSFFGGRLFCHGAAWGARNEETRITTNRVLMDEERRRYRNTGKDININVDIYNNRQETWGRTDY